ncbi:MAG: folate-binding protein [Synechococcaceae cyanobacterium]|nr:folate-binding protein [Synechococcaceae cyanobacterium]
MSRSPAASPPSPASPWDWRPGEPSLLLQPLTLLRLDGPDTRRFLHGQTTQAIEAAAPGARLSACCVGPTARMKALVEVLVDADGAWLAITQGDGEALHQAFDRVLFPADAVRLQPPRPALLCTPLGPDPAAPGPDPQEHWRPAEAGQGWWLGESLLLGPLSAPASAGDPAVPPAGLPAALAGRRVLSAAEAERWRLQQGHPAIPGELNDDTNPFELGLAARVSLGKGCYVGQETLAKLATYDGVKQQLRRWFCVLPPGSPSQPPRPGQELRTPEGERAGRVTSSLALADGLWIGLALVRRAQLEADGLSLAEGGVTLWMSAPAELLPPPQGPGSRPRP